MPRAKPAGPYDLRQSPFFRLRTKLDLAQLLHLDRQQLSDLAKNGVRYCEWDERSKSGKVRRIEKPSDRLARIQKRISGLLTRVAVPAFLFCPAKGKSYVTNAAQHVDGYEVRCLDVKSYFASTSSKRVFWFFSHVMECSRDVAGILTLLATYQGHLPTGSPLSPVLYFYAHLDMWETVSDLASAERCTVTVYMDDITISGPKVSECLMWQVKQAIHRNGLRYHKAKHFPQGRAREVTGVIIDKGHLAIPNRQHEKMHQLRRDLSGVQEGAEREHLERKLQGRMAQASQILAQNGAMVV